MKSTRWRMRRQTSDGCGPAAALWTCALVAMVALAGPPGAARAQDSQPTLTEEARGPVTNLPLPRYVSIKASEANVRRGPSLSHRIDWVFTRPDLPVQIIAEYGHWRRIRDREGASGWVHYSLLSGVRTAVVTAPMADLHMQPGGSSPLAAQAEEGVVLRLLRCDAQWCQASADGYRGWVRKDALWGVGPEEILE